MQRDGPPRPSVCQMTGRIKCKKKKILNLPADLDDLHRLRPLGPEEAPGTSRWGVGELITEMCMCTVLGRFGRESFWT